MEVVINNILFGLIWVYYGYCQNEMLFYREMKKACKKNRGQCKNCSQCWSCPRKIYVDEYKESLKDERI